MAESSYVLKQPVKKHLFSRSTPVLTHIDVELTERCNNACIHCYINQPANDESIKNRELTTNQWMDILSQAAKLGALSVRFTGGEPLLRDDFIELYTYARKLGMKVMLFTNARMINQEIADLFVKIPPMKKIEISVYGMGSESYDKVACFQGAFREYERGVKHLIDRQIPFVVKSILLPPNRQEIEEFTSWATRLPGMKTYLSYVALLDLRGRRDLPAKNRLIKKLRLSPDEIVTLMAKDKAGTRMALADFSSRFLTPPGDKLFICGAGEAGCVDAYGTYQMCILLRHPDVVYKLDKGSLRDAKTTAFPMFREMRAKNSEYLSRCARCFIKSLCEQCPAKSWTEHGTLDTPVEYLCAIAHAQARYLELLRENEHAWEIDDWRERITNLGIS